MLYGSVPDINSSNIEDEIRRSMSIYHQIEQLRPSNLLLKNNDIDVNQLVTVILPFFNARHFLEMCLKGLLIQSYRNLEIFCIDDHSTDDSYGKAIDLFGQDQRVCFIRLKKNVGHYQIKNFVLSKLARGNIIAMQDADDISHPMRITLQRKYLLDENIDVCGTCIHQFFPAHIPPLFRVGLKLRDEVGQYEHSCAIYESIAANKEPLSFADFLGESRQDRITMHGTQMFKKDLLLRFGGFDGHTTIGADTDLNWRLLRFSSIKNIPKILYSRRYHEHQLTRSPVTGHGSIMRRKYIDRRNAEHESIRAILERGDPEKVQDLCTQDLYSSDVEVDAIHTHFDINL